MMNQYTGWGAVLLFVLVGGYLIQAERIPVGNGVGWDGSVYAGIIRDFHGSLREGKVDGTKVSRILPAFVLHAAMRLLKLPRTDEAVVWLCVGWNVLMLGLMLWGAWRLAEPLGLSPAGRFALQVALAVNFIFVKMAGFYPVLFDPTAVAVMVWLLDAHLRGQSLLVLVLGVVGAYCSTTTMLISVPLLLFSGLRSAPDEEAPPSWAGAVALALSAVVVAGYLGYLWWNWTSGMEGRFIYWLEKGLITRPIRSLLVPTIILNVAYLLAAFFWLFRAGLSSLRPRQWSVRGVCLGALLAATHVAVVLIVNAWLGRFLKPGYTPDTYIGDAIGFGLVRPLGHLVAHGAYFGPVLFLIVRYWGQTSSRLGGDIGLLVASGLGVALSFDSESRHLVQFFALFAPFAVAACDRDGLWPRLLLPFLVVSLFFSKFWMPMGMLSDWLQMFFAHQGPFMGHVAYVVHLACLIVGGLGMLAWLRYTAEQQAGVALPLARPRAAA
jgi:hypothetical protein